MPSPDPIEDIEADSSARLTQAAHALSQFCETAARLHQVQTQRRAEAERAAEAGQRQQQDLEREQVAQVWSRAHDADWAAAASDQQIAETWSSATAWADVDRRADRARIACEAEMGRRWPDAMGHYQRLRATGQAPTDALRATWQTFTNAGWSPHERPFHAGPAPERAALTARSAGDGEPGEEPGTRNADPTTAPNAQSHAAGSTGPGRTPSQRATQHAPKAARSPQQSPAQRQQPRQGATVGRTADVISSPAKQPPTRIPRPR